MSVLCEVGCNRLSIYRVAKLPSRRAAFEWAPGAIADLDRLCDVVQDDPNGGAQYIVTIRAVGDD